MLGGLGALHRDLGLPRPRAPPGRLIQAFTSMPCRREYDATDPVRALRYRDDATCADAWYLAMTSRVTCPLVATDSRMSAAAAAHVIEIIGPGGPTQPR